MGIDEWFKQSDYDFETAEFMNKGGRQVYAVFMCHLSIEKALKGFYHKKSSQIPPRIHSLIALTKKIEIDVPENIGKFLVRLDQASLVTRYPEDLSKIQNDYSLEIVNEIIQMTKETLTWVKRMS